MTAGLAAAAAAALATWLLLRPRTSLGSSTSRRGAARTGRRRMRRDATVVLAGLGVWTLVGGLLGLVLAVPGAIVAHLALTRSEPGDARRRREQLAAELPYVVTLLGCALRSGSTAADGLAVVRAALPGPAAEDLGPVLARLDLGADPAAAWGELEAHPGLAPLGRALARAQRGGTSVVLAVERLADDLARAEAARIEDRARAVGVRAAVPLGVCLLPSFLLLGVVPMVAGLARDLGW